ncbi:uncharacterized protein LOC111270963 isoform X2 [Varroa jacobsoni]|uniref:uncharacterized protein LOC111270963 isoform X2 n=1 Tax=Varroa jacobsoni TaxID=62625 RepID=UPI000BF87FFB|nr:uncharacterized protein LOC111270963 isoform X2 [Varroa jacobsoni]
MSFSVGKMSDDSTSLIVRWSPKRGHRMASGSAGSSVVPPADEQLEASVAMNNEDSADGFLNSGRTGRRNALPDILDEQFTATTTADLPHELDKLSCSDQGPSPSGVGQNQPSTSGGAN